MAIKSEGRNIRFTQIKIGTSLLLLLLLLVIPIFQEGKTEEVDNLVSAKNELSLNWKKLDYSDFGYTQHEDETQINIYDNGNAQIAVYHAETPYMSYYNKETEEWTVVDSTWWEHGAPEILWAGDGVFLAKITGIANIISSTDGITWNNAGYSENAQNAMTTGAYDNEKGVGVVSWFYNKKPLYYSSDSLTERTEWTLVAGTEDTPVPFFKYLTAHKGSFVGVVGGDKSIAVANPTNLEKWTTTIPENKDENRYMFIRSVNDKLFVMKYQYKNDKYHVNLSVLNDEATKLTKTNLSHIGDLADNNIPNPQNIIWMEEWQKYALFNEDMLYVSDDGLTWEGIEQEDFTTTKYDTFGGAIYVPGDGFYVKASGYVYYAPYAKEM